MSYVMNTSAVTPSVDEYFRSKYGEAQKLTRANYAIWSYSMGLLLANAQCWDIVLGTEKAPVDPRLPESSTSDSSANLTPEDEDPSTSTAGPATGRATSTTGSTPGATGSRSRSGPTQSTIKKYEETLDDFNIRSARAASLIFSSLSSRLLTYVAGKKKPEEMWVMLKKRFDKSARCGAVEAPS